MSAKPTAHADSGAALYVVAADDWRARRAKMVQLERLASNPFVIRCRLSPAPAELARWTLANLVPSMSSSDTTSHSTTLRELGVDVGGLPVASVADIDALKWDHPFRYRSKHYMSAVAVDAAVLTINTFVRAQLGASLVILADDADPDDDFSLEFALAVLRFCSEAVVVLGCRNDAFQDAAIKKRWPGILWKRFEVNPMPEMATTILEPWPPSIGNANGRRRLIIEATEEIVTGSAKPGTAAAVLAEAARFWNISGCYAHAVRQASKAEQLLIGVEGDPLVNLRVFDTMFMAASCLNDAEVAKHAADEMLDLATRRGVREYQLRARYYLATYFLRHQRPAKTDAAEEQLNIVAGELDTRDLFPPLESCLFSAFVENTRALVLYNRQLFDSADAACRAAISHLDGHSDSRAMIEQGTFWYNRSQIAEARADWQGAVECMQKALKLEPLNGDYHIVLGNYLRAQGHPAQAILHFQQASEIGPVTPELLINFALTSLEIQDTTTALELLHRLRTRFPSRIEGFLDAGAYLIETCELDEAKRILEAGLVWHPTAASIWCNLGRVAQEAEDVERAEICFRRSIALDPMGKEAWVNLGALQFEGGDVQTARHSLEVASRIDPSDTTILENIAILNQSLANNDAR